jgi:hypothetical protein
MESNKLTTTARTAIADQVRPTTPKGYGAWLLALLIAAFLAVGMIGTLYTAAFKPVDRAGAAAALPPVPPAPKVPKWDVGHEPAGYWEYANPNPCQIGSPNFYACIDSDRRSAEAEYRREHAAWQRKEDAYQKKDATYQAEYAKWERTVAAHDAEVARISKSARRPLPARLAERWQFWAGVVLLGGSIAAAANREQPTVPTHRDPEGAAAAAVKADHAAGGAVLTVAGAAGGGLLATLHSFGAFAIVGGIAGLIAWGSVAAARRNRLTAEGYRVADAQWQEAAQAAERAGQPVPPEPRVAVSEASKLGETGGFTAPAGSAMAVMLDEAGNTRPSAAAWNRVATAMGMGTTDAAGRFQPWAQLEHATWWKDSGDVELAFRLEDVTKTAADMNRVAGPLLRELRVRALMGGAFVTRHTDGRIVGRFTNNAEAPAATTAAAAVDDDWDF